MTQAGGGVTKSAVQGRVNTLQVHDRMRVSIMKMHEPECVKMKRRGAALVAEKIAGMSRTEQLEYWRELSRKMLERKASLMAEK